ncbi:CLUMA_CG003399, isoform A [Clunio marinus]|uniref:CLUMA_CG003399, isoform A n=1 Tax=Clunio marinus TaxID=568069 RepID=A0A1J1HT51_9DIPT|nr:CLUMA_CG003399, isoform A [Clunio marinus]
MDYCEKCSRNENIISKMDSNDHQQSSRSFNNYHRTQICKSSNNRHHFLSFKMNFATSSLLLVLLATIIQLSSASSPCLHREYWDMEMDQCVPCSKCNKHQIVIRPCQRHMDTVCKPLNSIEIDWSKSFASEKPTTHFQSSQLDNLSSKSHKSASQLSEEEMIWDWELISLILAVAACLLFFVGTAFISINYIRQWRKIKKQFDTDIEGLSQQLMARLAMPPLETSTIFIDDPSTKRSALGPRQIEVRCVYFEDILDGKECLKNPQESHKAIVSKGPNGNVYIKDHEKQQHHVSSGHKPV